MHFFLGLHGQLVRKTGHRCTSLLYQWRKGSARRWASAQPAPYTLSAWRQECLRPWSEPVEAYQQLEALLDLAGELGITVRQLAGAAAGAEHPGGALVRLRGQDVLFLDSTAAVADQLAVAAAALAGRGQLENRFLPPQLRQVIDEHAARARGKP